MRNVQGLLEELLDVASSPADEAIGTPGQDPRMGGLGNYLRDWTYARNPLPLHPK